MNWYKTSQSKITSEMVQDPNCPPEILAEVLRRGKEDVISMYAAGNINCPPEILAEVLRKGESNQISWKAVDNWNCPKEIKWLWEHNLFNPKELSEPSLVALSYLEAPPEIKQNQEVINVVKKSIINFLGKRFVEFKNEFTNSANKVLVERIKRLLKILSKDDFIISLFYKKMDDLKHKDVKLSHHLLSKNNKGNKISKKIAEKKVETPYPYKIVVIKYGIEQTPQQLENVIKDAYSPNQARLKFLKSYPLLKDYYQLGYEIEARFDREEFKKRQEQDKINKEVQERQKEQKEEAIQNSWWNQ
jgi:hypothetical protein